MISISFWHPGELENGGEITGTTALASDISFIMPPPEPIDSKALPLSLDILTSSPESCSILTFRFLCNCDIQPSSPDLKGSLSTSA